MARQYNAGTAHVDIRPKFDGFARELRDKMRKFDPEVEVKLKASRESLVKEVKAALQDVDRQIANRTDTRVTVKAIADVSDVSRTLDLIHNSEVTVRLVPNTDDVDNALGRLDDSEVTVRVFADTTAARDDLSFDDVETTVEVHADTEQARDDIEKVAHDDHTAEIDTKAHTHNAKEAIKDVEEADYTATINADADTAWARTKIAWAARDRWATIHVYANTKKAFEELSKLQLFTLGIGRASTAIGMGGGAIGGIGTLATGAIAPTAALANNIVALTGALNLAPAAIGGFAAGLAGIIIGSQGVGDAFKNLSKDGADLEESIKDLTPAAQEFVRSTHSLSDEWKNVKESAQEALFTGLGPAIQNLGEKQLPTLASGLAKINEEVATGARAAMDTLATTAAQKDFEVFLNNAATMFTGVSRGVNALAQSWIDLATVGSQYLPNLGETIGSSLEQWTRNIHGARITGQLQEDMQRGVDAIKSVGHAMQTTGGIIKGVWAAMDAAGQPFISTINSATVGMRNWTNSAEGQQVMVNLFTETGRSLGALVPVATAAGRALTTQVMPAMSQLIQGVAPGAANGIAHIGNAFERLAPTLGTVGMAAGRFIEAFGRMTEAFAPVISAVGSLIGSLSNLAPVIVPVAAALTIGKGVGAAWTALAKEIDTVKNVFTAFKRESVEVDTTMAKVAGRTRVAGTGLRAVGNEMRYTYAQARGLAPALEGVNRMWQFMPRTMAASKAAMTGVSRAMSGVKAASGALIGALGGPLNVGLMAATAAVGVAVTSLRELDQYQKATAETARAAGRAQGEFFRTILDGGKSLDVAVAQVDNLNKHLDNLSKGNDWKVELGGTMKASTSFLTGDLMGFATNTYQRERGAADANSAEQAQKALDALGMSSEQLGSKIVGTKAEWSSFMQQVLEMPEGGAQAAVALQRLRAEYEHAQAQLAALTPAQQQMAAALQDVASQAGDAASRLDSYRIALAEMQGLPISAAEAQKQLTKEIAQTAQQMETFAGAQFNAQGYIDTTTQAGVALHDALMGLGHAASQAVASGTPAQEVFARISPELDNMARSSGLAGDEWNAMLEKLSLTPDKIEVLAEVQDDQAKMAINALQEQIDKLKDGDTATVELGVENQAAVDKLTEMGFKVDEYNAQTGVAKLGIDDDGAKERYEWWISNGFPEIDMANPTAKVNLDDTGLMFTAEYAKFQLDTLDGYQAVALGDLDISALDANAVAALQAVGILDASGAVPNADLTIDQLNENQRLALAQLFALDGERPTPLADLNKDAFDRNRDAAQRSGEQFAKQKFDAQAGVKDNATSAFRGILNSLRLMAQLNPINIAVRAMRGNAAGGVALPAYADGGMSPALKKLPGYTRGRKLPTAGPGTHEVDGFTGVDASGSPFVRLDAGEWIINRKSSRKHDALLRAINNDDPRLAKMGDLPAYRVGGIATPRELLAFARGQNVDGQQASGSLEGARYVFGGSNWGDCSSSQGQLALFAAGRPATVGRYMSTADEGPKLTALGFLPGLGSGPRYAIGWRNGGPAGGHTSGSIFMEDGQKINVEMGGARGNGQIGGQAAGADAAYNTTGHMHLPLPTSKQDLVFGTDDVDGYTPRTSKMNDADRTAALKKLQKNYDRMDKLEKQLPELEREVELAEMKRDETYNKTDKKGNPTASASSKVSADESVRKKKKKVEETKQEIADLTAEIKALEQQLEMLESEVTQDPTKSKDPQTWSEIAGNFAKDTVEGNIKDLFGILGVSDDLPGTVKAYKLYQEANGREPWEVDPKSIAALEDMGRDVAAGDFETAFKKWNIAKAEKAREREAAQKRELRAKRLAEAQKIGGYAGSAYEQAAIAEYDRENRPTNGNPGHTYDPQGGAEQWRETMVAAYKRQGYDYDATKIDAWVRQIKSESGGDPNIAQQIVDVNGTGESAGVGLGQMIPTTWAAYRDPELSDNRRDPWAMANAMVRYGEKKYGKNLLNVIGHGHGYARGGDVWGAGTGRSDDILALLSNGEHVTPEHTAKLARPLLNAMDHNPELARTMNGIYQAAQTTAPGVTNTVENHYHIETNNLDEGLRRAERMAARAVATMGR